MKKTKFHRLTAFTLAICFLLGGMFTVSAAADQEQSTTDKTLAEIKEQLNAISYDEYSKKYLATVDKGEGAIVIDATNYVEYKSGGEKYEVKVVVDETTQLPKGLYTPGAGTSVSGRRRLAVGKPRPVPRPSP